MKRITNLGDYVNVLPYASEIFGVYQPLLGWRSKQIKERVQRGFAKDLAAASRAVFGKIDGRFLVNFNERGIPEIQQLAPGVLAVARSRTTGTFLTDAIARDLPSLEQHNESVWDVLDPVHLSSLLTDTALPTITKWASASDSGTAAHRGAKSTLVVQQLQRESAMAGYLLYLKETKQFDTLKELFYKSDLDVAKLTTVLRFRDPLDYFDHLRTLTASGYHRLASSICSANIFTSSTHFLVHLSGMCG